MNTTLRSFAQARLEALCHTVDFEPAIAAETLDMFLAPWGDCSLRARPPWPSDITDDHTPVELSLSIEGNRLEPRFLVEVQGRDGSLASAWSAARETNERLHRRYGVSLARLAEIEALFEPRGVDARFGMWHAVWLRPAQAPLFKIYLNPQVQGRGEAPALVEEALRRLGFSRAWSFLAAQLGRRGVSDDLIYFSLDLDGGAHARVKVYVAHPRARVEEIDPLLASGPDHVHGDAERFCRAMTGGTGPFHARPLLTCFAFTDPAEARPQSVTLHLPIRCYVDSDQVALHRISSYLGEGTGSMYRRAITAIAGRPLDARTGIQTYVSLQRRRGGSRVTVYLGLEAYTPSAPRRQHHEIRTPVGHGAPDQIMASGRVRPVVVSALRYASGSNFEKKWDSTSGE